MHIFNAEGHNGYQDRPNVVLVGPRKGGWMIPNRLPNSTIMKGMKPDERDLSSEMDQ